MNRNAPIRISHVLTNLDLGGTQVILLQCLRHLDSKQFDHNIFSLNGRSTAFDAGRLRRQLGELAPIYDVNLRETIHPGDVTGILRLAWRLRQLRPDIVHTYHFRGMVYGTLAARLAGIPAVVCSDHALSSTGIEGKTRDWRARQAYRLIGRLASQMVTVSEATRREMIAWGGISPARVEVIPNGVDYPPSPVDRAAVRQRLGIAPDCSLVVAAGRLDPIKGFDHLIAAAPLLPDSLAIQILIAGGGPEHDHLAHFIRQLQVEDRVHLLGPIDNVPELLAAADVVAMTSRSETFGLVAAEAMASGTAVVASAVGGLPELIEPGRSGVLVPYAHPRALGEAIVDLIRRPDLRRQLARNGQERIRESFTVSQMADRYAKLYCQLVEAPRTVFDSAGDDQPVTEKLA
ncbi:MAG TPA: glycosyltransferase [Chloroflexota bacterium]|nr:glycosyltransferase [Chloroflexota bacterium]